MCPWFKISTKQCRISPASEAGAIQSEDGIQYRCMHHDNYRKCANLEKYEKGEYKVER